VANAARAAAQAAPAPAPLPAAVPLPALPPLPPVMIGGREIPRQPTLVSVPVQPLPRDPAMPPALVMAPPAPQPQQPLPPAVAPAPGPVCDACGNAVPADLPKTNEMIICDLCKAQGELEERPLEDLV
jgi:homeobox protein ESX1